ncbi:hypothetical protein ACA758_00185 [Mycoplasmopsis agassizii]|uniref:hypothetical protein n=1 Tax=Mycoplasmopsis agassizii TaxID=33922 RepID=UPI003528E237
MASYLIWTLKWDKRKSARFLQHFLKPLLITHNKGSFFLTELNKQFHQAWKGTLNETRNHKDFMIIL